MSKVVGKMDQAEIEALDSMQLAVNELTFEIGRTEEHKASLLQRLGVTKAQMQQILTGVAQRVGVPKDVQWWVQKDHTILVEER